MMNLCCKRKCALWINLVIDTVSFHFFWIFLNELRCLFLYLQCSMTLINCRFSTCTKAAPDRKGHWYSSLHPYLPRDFYSWREAKWQSTLWCVVSTISQRSQLPTSFDSMQLLLMTLQAFRFIEIPKKRMHWQHCSFCEPAYSCFKYFETVVCKGLLCCGSTFNAASQNLMRCMGIWRSRDEQSTIFLA